MPKRVVLGIGYPSISGNGRFPTSVALTRDNHIFAGREIRLKNLKGLDLPGRWKRGSIPMGAPVHHKIRLVAEIIR